MKTFSIGDKVCLKEPENLIGADVGVVGIIWDIYGDPPSAYEVTFVDASGNAFEITVADVEISLFDNSL